MKLVFQSKHIAFWDNVFSPDVADDPVDTD